MNKCFTVMAVLLSASLLFLGCPEEDSGGGDPPPAPGPGAEEAVNLYKALGGPENSNVDIEVNGSLVTVNGPVSPSGDIDVGNNVVLRVAGTGTINIPCELLISKIMDTSSCGAPLHSFLPFR
jgi:hypothetical protein